MLVMRFQAFDHEILGQRAEVKSRDLQLQDGSIPPNAATNVQDYVGFWLLH
jgi:hypothetical protein